MCFSLYLYFDVIFTGTSGWAHGDALVMCVCVCVCVCLLLCYLHLNLSVVIINPKLNLINSLQKGKH